MIAIAVLLLAGCGDGSGDADSAPVTLEERVWVDDTRTTPRTVAFAGAPTRTLRTRLWRPAAGQQLPLMVLAHGFGGLPERFDAFAGALAAAGMIVAAPAFPLTNADAPGGHIVGLADYIQQPGDVSFVIDQVLAASEVTNDALYGRVDANAIALLGHSLGGATVLAAAHLACCHDQRIGAAIISAAPWRLVAGSSPAPLVDGPPTLLLHGSADATVPVASSSELYELLAPPRLLVGIDGAGHSEALEDDGEPASAARDAAQRAVIAFVRAVFSGARRGLKAELSELAAQGHVVQSDGIDGL